jgi:phytoene dehydrogenase-like protein
MRIQEGSMADSIIIIGAGIAGLAAGCYGQMNGYQTRIFEMHDLPGGLCTSWERKGYVIDGCIHYLFGSGAGQSYHRLWQELGVANRPMIDHEELMRVVDSSGRVLVAFANPDRWEAHLKALSPADAKLSEDLADGVRRFRDFDLSALQAKPRSLMEAMDWLDFNREVLPYTLPMAKWGRVTAREYAARFEDPFLRRAFAHLFGWPDIPVMAGLQLLAYMANGNAGFPVGGSLAFARAVVARYEALGGHIEYKAQVERILVEDSRAVGVRLYDDREFRADVVISAADGRGTIFDMLDGAFADRQIRRFYDGRLPTHTQLQVSLGVARDLAAEPHWVTYLLDEPIRIAGEERAEIGVKHYCFDPSLAPPGKSVVEVMMPSRYGYWQRIYGRRLYDIEQLQVAEAVIGFLEGIYPGIRDAVEVKDVATPLSYERFTGNWRGATTGWLLTEKTMPLLIQGMPKTLPDLDGFYMCGQWVEPGGMVPTAGMSGRNVIQLVCAADGRPFQGEG